MNTFFGQRFTISEHATKRVEHWPVKPRSKRLHKKLTKLRGPQFTEEPCVFTSPFGIVVHTKIADALRARAVPAALAFLKGGAV